MRDQIGHFCEVLDLVDIGPNLIVVLWNLPKIKFCIREVSKLYKRMYYRIKVMSYSLW